MTTKKQEEKIMELIKNTLDKGYNLGQERIISILENEVRQGLNDGFIGVKYSCLLELLGELRRELK